MVQTHPSAMRIGTDTLSYPIGARWL